MENIKIETEKSWTGNGMVLVIETKKNSNLNFDFKIEEDLVICTDDGKFVVTEKYIAEIFDMYDSVLDFNGLDNVDKVVKFVKMLRMSEAEKEQLKDELYPEKTEQE